MDSIIGHLQISKYDNNNRQEFEQNLSTPKTTYDQNKISPFNIGEILSKGISEDAIFADQVQKKKEEEEEIIEFD